MTGKVTPQIGGGGRLQSPQNLVGGLLLIALALLVFWQGQDLEVGHAMRMGPGYFPRILAILIAACGVILVGMSVFAKGEALEAWSLKRIALVLGSILLFSFAIRTLGLAITGVALVLVASLAAPDLRWRETAVFTVALVAFAALLFPVALGLPLPIWPR